MTDSQQFDESRWRTVAVKARVLNLTPRRVQQLAKEGHIPQGRRGVYEFVPTVQGYCRYLQHLAAQRNDTASPHAIEVLKQRAAKLKWENEVARGEFIPRGEVITGLRAATGYIRAKMLAIAVTAAPKILEAETVAEVKEILTDRVHAALDELSRTRFIPVGEDDTPATKKLRRQRSPR